MIKANLQLDAYQSLEETFNYLKNITQPRNRKSVPKLNNLEYKLDKNPNLSPRFYSCSNSRRTNNVFAQKSNIGYNN